MSLIKSLMCDYARLIRKQQKDGACLKTSFEEKERFSAAVTLKKSEAAESAGVMSPYGSYVVTVNKSVPLSFGNIIKRLSDGKAFIIISDVTAVTPLVSGLDLKQFYAKDYEIPGESAGESI